jgi:Family of unknown function (DUF5996)
MFPQQPETVPNVIERPDPGAEPFPRLEWDEWSDTCQTLHMWTQIVGKIRLKLSPMMNEWWQVPLYVTARGLTTSPIPYASRTFEIVFDFIDHQLRVFTSRGETRAIALEPRSVKSFYEELMSLLRALGIEVQIWTRPVEVNHTIRFEEDEVHASYDTSAVNRFFRALVQSDVALKAFRARFTGKASPVQFFWGTFDLAVSLFSGRPATAPPSSDLITRVAYADEQVEVGFWPGNDKLPRPAYFSFTYPAPQGIAEQPIRPSAAFWHPELKEFILLYDDVRSSESPLLAMAEFFQSTYEAGVSLAGWDRSLLERSSALS